MPQKYIFNQNFALSETEFFKLIIDEIIRELKMCQGNQSPVWLPTQSAKYNEMEIDFNSSKTNFPFTISIDAFKHFRITLVAFWIWNLEGFSSLT